MGLMCLYFFYVPDAVTLTSFLAKKDECFLNTASVGGRRRKSAEEQCAEFQARARPDNHSGWQEVGRGHHAELPSQRQRFLWPTQRDEKGWRVTTTTREPRRAVLVRRSPRVTLTAR